MFTDSAVPILELLYWLNNNNSCCGKSGQKKIEITYHTKREIIVYYVVGGGVFLFPLRIRNFDLPSVHQDHLRARDVVQVFL